MSISRQNAINRQKDNLYSTFIPLERVFTIQTRTVPWKRTVKNEHQQMLLQTLKVRWNLTISLILV